MYYSGTEWALSSINQHGLWERRPTLDRDGHVSVLSVDIGDFNTPSEYLVDEFGRGKAARDCTADEIAAEVWRQIVVALTNNVDNAPEELLPWPAWYALDRGLVLEYGPGQGEGRVIRNVTPYLVPIVGDWLNRPGGHPWNPHDSILDSRSTRGRVARQSGAAQRLAGAPRRLPGTQQLGGVRGHMDQNVHADDIDGGGVRVGASRRERHPRSLRLGRVRRSRSARKHNARLAVSLRLHRSGFLESNSNADPGRRLLLRLRHREQRACRHSRSAQPRRRVLPGVAAPPVGHAGSAVAAPTPRPPTHRRPTHDHRRPTTASSCSPTFRPGGRYWNRSTPMAPGLSCPGAPPAMPGMPPAMPGMPPMPPTAAESHPMPPSPADYTQQLLAYLQAWRHYLEQATGAATGPPPSTTPPTPPPQPTPGRPPQVPRRPDVPAGSRRGVESGSSSGSETARALQLPIAPGDSLASSDSPDRSSRGSQTVRPPDVLRGPANRFGSFLDDLGRYRRVRDAMRAAESPTRREATRRTSERSSERLLGSPFTGPVAPAGSGTSSPATHQSLYSSATPHTRQTTSWASGLPHARAVVSNDEPEAPKEKDVPVPPGQNYGHQA